MIGSRQEARGGETGRPEPQGVVGEVGGGEGSWVCAGGAVSGGGSRALGEAEAGEVAAADASRSVWDGGVGVQFRGRTERGRAGLERRLAAEPVTQDLAEERAGGAVALSQPIALGTAGCAQDLVENLQDLDADGH